MNLLHPQVHLHYSQYTLYIFSNLQSPTILSLISEQKPIDTLRSASSLSQNKNIHVHIIIIPAGFEKLMKNCIKHSDNNESNDS
jgi:hypothetical protein